MASIPQQTIEQVADANDIVEVIGSYFPLKRAGATFKALCPFHQEKSPSFTVNPQRQIFKCFGCNEGGSVFKFVERYEHVSFPEAVRKLAARAGIAIIEERGASLEEDRQHESRHTLLKLHAEAAEWFHENLLKREFSAPAREYLRGRGLDRAIAVSWKLGFAPDSWDAFMNWAREQGYSRRWLLESGLVKLRDEERPESEVYDRFRGRIMFPIRDDLGQVIAFSGRVLEAEAKAAKYLNSPETSLFKKGSVLFGLDKSKRSLIEAGCAIVCEGQLDLIALFEAGISNVVAPQGTAFTEKQARILKQFVSEVVLCFDSDTAGQKAAERSLEALLQYDLIVRVAEMPAGQDPDSLVREEGAEAFRARVSGAREFFDYWIDRELATTDLTSLGAKMQLARKMAESVGRVHDAVLRGEVINRVTARLGVSPRDFETLLPKPNRERRAEAEPTANIVAVAPSHEIAMLCLLALRDSAAREFLLAQRWREALVQMPGSELLIKILEADLRPDEAASTAAFLATLPSGEEALASSWMLQKLPPNGDRVARDWWAGLRQAAVRRELQTAESRMKLPQLTMGEVVSLQKQILDLKRQLTEVPPSAPAGSLSS